MEQQQAELTAAGPPERPVNAPPTYEDAMKQEKLYYKLRN